MFITNYPLGCNMTEEENGVIAEYIAEQKAEAIKAGHCDSGTDGCTGHQIGHHHEGLGETFWVCSDCDVGVWY